MFQTRQRIELKKKKSHRDEVMKWWSFLGRQRRSVPFSLLFFLLLLKWLLEWLKEHGSLSTAWSWVESQFTFFIVIAKDVIYIYSIFCICRRNVIIIYVFLVFPVFIFVGRILSVFLFTYALFMWFICFYLCLNMFVCFFICFYVLLFYVYLCFYRFVCLFICFLYAILVFQCVGL